MSQLLTRELTLGNPASDGGIPCTIATCVPVLRNGQFEVLSCDVAHVDLTRAPLPLIVGHDASGLAVGLVDSIRCEGSRVTGVARFGASETAKAIKADVESGIHRSLSVGYVLTGIVGQSDEDGTTTYAWRPHETSIVSVPADTAAGFYRSLSTETAMTTATTPQRSPATPAPAPLKAPVPTPAQPVPDQTFVVNRSAEIADLCTRHGLGHMTGDLIRSGADLAKVKDSIIDELARRDYVSGGHHNTRSDSRSNDGELILNTLVARMGGRPAGQTLARSSLIDLATRSLAASGQAVHDGEHGETILKRAFGAHTTSDFPRLIGAAAGRVLAQEAESLQSPIKPIARKINRPDFRPLSSVRFDSAPDLLKTNEHGEFKYGTLTEAANGWQLATHGRIIAITRQALINDDLGAFAAAISGFAQSAARLEADAFAAQLLAPADIDDKPMFDATRGTLITKALSVDGLAAAVLALRAQRGLHGGLLSQQPGTLIVPAALEMKALQLVASIAPTTTADVQPFAGLAVAVEPRLDAISSTAWYLAARNQMGLEYGYLDGQEGVQLDERQGFEVDGTEYRARLDFGCGWAAPVGWVKSSGTQA